MAILEESQPGWLFNILMEIVAALSMVVMTLMGVVWKSQGKKIDEMKTALAADKLEQAGELKDIRDDIESKHAENREDILTLHSDIKQNDQRAQDRHNELMIYLRDR